MLKKNLKNQQQKVNNQTRTWKRQQELFHRRKNTNSKLSWENVFNTTALKFNTS